MLRLPRNLHMEVHKALRLPRNPHLEVHTVLRLPRNLHMEVHSVLCLPRNLHMEVHTVLCLPRNLHMEVHKVLCLPRDLHTEVHKVLRLPRNLHMKVHKVLRLPRNLHIKRRCPADARAYIRPLGKQQAPHTARKCYRQSAGAQPTPGRTSDPLASSKRRTQHANATGRAPVPSRRQGVHPTPWQAASAAHGTQMLPAEHRCPADARAYIRPLGKQQAPHTARKCYRQSAGAQPTPGRTSDPLASSKRRTQHAKATGRAPVPSRRQGVHPTPWQAASAAHSTQMLPAERRCPADARAYIRPLGKQQVPHTARKCYGEMLRCWRCCVSDVACEMLCVECCVSDV